MIHNLMTTGDNGYSLIRDRYVSTSVRLSKVMMTEDLVSREFRCFTEIDLKSIERLAHA